jgi:hypothetical protein
MEQSLSPRIYLRSLLVALGVAIGGLAGGSALALLVVLLVRSAGVELTPILAIVLSLTFVQGVAFGGMGYAYLRYRGLSIDYLGVRVPSLREVGFVVGGYVAAMGAIIVLGTLVSLLGVQPGTNQAAEFGQSNPETLLLLIPASFLLIGPGEELLFRGVVQNRLRETFGPVVGVGTASVIFAAIHYTALSGTTGARLVTIAILFFPSLIFGTVYELTDNLVVPALVHGTYNATLFGLLYVAIRFAQTQPPALL